MKCKQRPYIFFVKIKAKVAIHVDLIYKTQVGHIETTIVVLVQDGHNHS